MFYTLGQAKTGGVGGKPPTVLWKKGVVGATPNMFSLNIIMTIKQSYIEVCRSGACRCIGRSVKVQSNQNF